MGDLDDGVRGECWDIMEESGCGEQEKGFGGMDTRMCWISQGDCRYFHDSTFTQTLKQTYI